VVGGHRPVDAEPLPDPAKPRPSRRSRYISRCRADSASDQSGSFVQAMSFLAACNHHSLGRRGWAARRGQEASPMKAHRTRRVVTQWRTGNDGHPAGRGPPISASARHPRCPHRTSAARPNALAIATAPADETPTAAPRSAAE
jgi:hypothetical protein